MAMRPDARESVPECLPDGVAVRPAEAGSIWHFGACVLDERSLSLTVDGTLVAVEARPLELLLCLLSHAGEVVTKDELFEQVWPGRIVSDSVLTQAMAKLRQALGDAEQSLIKTVYGYGYRLVAPVRRELGKLPPPPPTLRAGEHPPLRPHWLLERQLGGGRSEVWLARHGKTGERHVFKFARDAASLRGLKREITLFRLLQQTLGERPDMLRLLDWNLEELPYFIEQEYIVGGSLPEWIESVGGWAALPRALRLELVAQTAEALAAAHEAGVLHKDLKPGNLLVNTRKPEAPQVCLVDFGSGRMLDAGHWQGLEITRMGFTQTLAAGEQTSGTPLYLAPELMAGQPATVRSDLYSLGVLLYQMLVGDLRRPLAPGWEREVDDPLLCEDIAACADLAPQRRLASAAVLAERLRGLEQRHAQRAKEQAEQQNVAAAQQALERLRARRKGLVTVISVLLLGLSLSLKLYLDARSARQQAEAERQRAQYEARASRQVTDFVASLFEAANPGRNQGKAMNARQLVDEGKSRLKGRFSGQPLLEARMLGAIATLYCKLGQTAECRADLERAVALQTTTANAEPALTAELQARLGDAYLIEGRDTDAEATLRAALPALKAGLPQTEERLVETYVNLGEALAAQGQYDALLPMLEQARASLRSGMGAETLASATILGKLATTAYIQAHRYAEAQAGVEQKLKIVREQLGTDNEKYVEALGDQAMVFVLTQQIAKAEQATREILAWNLRRYGENSVQVANGRANLVAQLNLAGQLRAAEEQADLALAAYRHVGLAGTPEYAWALRHAGRCRYFRGNYAGAVADLRQAYDIEVRQFAETSLSYQMSRIYLGAALLGNGQRAEGMRLLQPEIPVALQGEVALRAAAWRLAALAEAESDSGAHAEAMQTLARLDALVQSLAFPNSEDLRRLAISRPRSLITQGRNAEALPLLKGLVPEYTRRYGAESPYTLVADILLAETLLAQGQSAEGHALLTRIAPAISRELAPAHRERLRFEMLRSKVSSR